MGARPYSVASLAEHWDCGTDTIYSLIKSGELQAFKVGGKLLRIKPEEVERYECQPPITASSDSVESSRSSGMRAEDATDIRLERLIERRPKPQLVHSGRGAEAR